MLLLFWRFAPSDIAGSPHTPTTNLTLMDPFSAGSDLVMSSERWSTCVVGKLSPWLDLDSPVTATRLASEKAFKQEVAWASHLTGAYSNDQSLRGSSERA